MDGILLVNKEMNMTSFDVVAKCRKILHEKRIGHTGTLDPNATGLLIILVGKYTKLLPYCVSNKKRYHAEFSFGKRSTTEDIWGDIVEEKAYQTHTKEELTKVAETMLGKSIQIPPMYSAIKVNGKKLYEYARSGIEVERPQREIQVDEFKVEQIGDNLYSLDVVVSSGTYVRTLIQDYAEKLNELAVMTALERISIEGLSVENAYTLKQIEKGEFSFASAIDVIDSEYEIIDYEDEFTIRCGKKIKLNASKDNVILKKDAMLLAAYSKKDDGYYYAQRGLF